MATSTTAVEFELESACQRFGEDYVANRLRLQAEHVASQLGLYSRPFHIENLPWFARIAAGLFRVTGLYERGHRNFMDVRIRHNTVVLPSLPAAFDGYTICHLTDLHLDLDPSLTSVIAERLDGIEYDLCVLTGDYRNGTHGPYDVVLEELAALSPHLASPVFATLGNHDFLEMAGGLEALGISVLVNERREIERDDEQILLAGVDDPNIYRTDDVARALNGADPSLTKILLSHSCCIYPTAHEAGVDLVLCGHTHGGQICLPGGAAVLSEELTPRWMWNGPWEYKGMKGYTSPGTGACAVPLRLFCPPEITLHHLQGAAPIDRAS
ncbi:MAG: metallophosphoesterase [Lentisphaerae bacterium]|nr:metallophosphoesterase [Lentisphaerota bacterium]MBT4814746.1 metallophosphoesterase [Lentisphaerota bacterium]MBT5605774.1 metallophosphoesterase [Lentisphaerota bacterium]MBT7055841.1 metallophosphoesterase [Lentisphaerota bacterium]MBT7840950.1 metallophosphoesterase [Lentisphaerota bacterium]